MSQLYFLLYVVYIPGADPLLCVLYETERHVAEEDFEDLQEVPKIWRFRTSISLEHMRQEFTARTAQTKGKKRKLALLGHFLEEV